MDRAPAKPKIRRACFSAMQYSLVYFVPRGGVFRGASKTMTHDHDDAAAAVVAIALPMPLLMSI
jgi:hypothetical protein